MKQYKLISCCGDCAMYDLKKHRCTAGAEDEGSPQDNFYADCPLKDGKLNKKPLKDYTLEEVQEECRRYTIGCEKCKFYGLCYPYDDDFDEMQFPINWNLDRSDEE